MIMDDNDGQIIFRDLVGLKLPDTCLIGEEKPRKNLTHETCPNQGSNPGLLHDMRAFYRLFHSGGPIEAILDLEKISHHTLELFPYSITQDLFCFFLKTVKSELR